MDKYILVDKKPIKCTDKDTFSTFFADLKNRRVALDKIGDITVSTIFLGWDHPFFKDMFETMVFIKGEGAVGMLRASTWEEAITNHNSYVRVIKRFGRIS